MTMQGRRFIKRFILSGLCCAGLVSCKDLAGTPPLPAGTSDPSIVQTTRGAVQTAAAAEVVFQTAFASYIPIAGVLTDELTANGRAAAILVTGDYSGTYWGNVQVDARRLDQATDWNETTPASTDGLYAQLQRVRELGSQAIGGLATYASDSTALRGKMYALMAYSEIMLADLYCSGVPLSTLDFTGTYTYQSGSTTTQLYTHALALLDTARMLVGSDVSLTNLANVGRGRAYLALGDYASAGQAVSTVPATFQFVDSIATCVAKVTTCPSGISGNVLASAVLNFGNVNTGIRVSDREAGTGLPFVSSGDPRTADTVLGTTLKEGANYYYPKKYKVGGISALVLASGIEAQLITAEADLNAENPAGAFTILNALRTNNTTTSGMPTLTDPGTFGAELDTLFTERAAWLFADGHRQGDLRRLQRNYVNGQGVQVVANQYPSEDYGFGIGNYGDFIDAPVPATELLNPHFTGCLSRD